MSSRPVPRRESPWGLPEGDTRQPQAHRCNDRAEDVIQACFEGNPFKTVPGPFKLFWRCMRSKPGAGMFGSLQHLNLAPEPDDYRVAPKTSLVPIDSGRNRQTLFTICSLILQ